MKEGIEKYSILANEHNEKVHKKILAVEIISTTLSLICIISVIIGIIIDKKRKLKKQKTSKRIVLSLTAIMLFICGQILYSYIAREYWEPLY